MSWWTNFKEKLNPVQPDIALDEGSAIYSTQTKLLSVQSTYEIVEVVNRSVNLIVDNAAMVNYDVGDSLNFTGQLRGVRPAGLNILLNHRPNPYMDISTFRRLIFMDFLIDGNAFIYFDGSSFYHVPAVNMVINPDDKGRVHSYEYNGSEVVFRPNEIIHIKDNSTKSIYRGDSRINSAMNSLFTKEKMQDFQNRFFDNGAVTGLIVHTDQILSAQLKDRKEREWMKNYNPKRGNGRPLILDGGMKVASTGSGNFREMAFSESVDKLETKVCQALGIPPLLLDSGNNANIKPNLELFFYTTVIPMLRKFESALEYHFAYDIELDLHRVPALKPDIKEQAERLSALVNNGIITGNEARKELRREEIDDPDMNEIRIPANVAGSATGVSGQEGGKPPKEDDE